MSGTLVDSNVLMDIFSQDPTWWSWSEKAVERCASTGRLYVNAVIYAEASVRFQTIEEVENAIPIFLFERLEIPMEAAFLAGKAYLLYRRAGGQRTSSLPDFFIGAHAAVSGLNLLTRDTRYASYFPTVQLISP